MTVDDVHALIAPTLTLQERVADRGCAIGLDRTTQYFGNRVRSTFYPEHWARVQIARDTARRYAE